LLHEINNPLHTATFPSPEYTEHLLILVKRGRNEKRGARFLTDKCENG
jgi:hypothetical protein